MNVSNRQAISPVFAAIKNMMAARFDISGAMLRQLLVALLCVCFSVPATADQIQWDTVDLKPWSFLDANNQGIGIHDDIIAEVTRRTGLTFEINRLPLARNVLRLRDGASDFTLAYRSPSAEEYSTFPVCVFTSPIVIIARKGIKLSSLDDLRGLEQGVGIIRGVFYGGRFESDAAIRKVEEPNFIQMLKKLDAGRLDAVAGASISLLYLAKAEKMEPIFGQRLVLSDNQFCLQVPKTKASSPQTLKVAEAIRAIEAEGLGAKIVSKYVDESWKSRR